MIDKKKLQKMFKEGQITNKKSKCLATSCCFIKNQQYANINLLISYPSLFNQTSEKECGHFDRIKDSFV